MKLHRPKLNPLLAFGVTVALLLAYLIAFVAIASTHRLSPSITAFGIWLLLPLLSAAFYLWLSPNESTSTGRRYFQVFAAILMAPLAAASLFMFLWSVVLGRSM